MQAAVDHVLAIGLADPDRLGVGGWSYGGILTDAIIAKDHRFKAATSGAGTAFPLGLYGVDQYIMQYDEEIGAPWKVGLDPWIRISYPFLHADQIKTPTLFLGGEKDFNVPLVGGEQMYQALAQSRCSDAVGGLSGAVPRNRAAELSEGSHGAISGLVREVFEGG